MQKLGAKIAENLQKFFRFCTIWSILHRQANSVLNSAGAESQNPGLSSIYCTMHMPCICTMQQKKTKNMKKAAMPL